MSNVESMKSTRKRRSEDTNSSDSSSSSSSCSRPKNTRRKKRSQKKMLKKLSRQLSDLQRFVFRRDAAGNSDASEFEGSENYGPSLNPAEPPIEPTCGTSAAPVFHMPDPTVSLKEPQMNAPTDAMLKTVERLQNFNSPGWCDVRYAKTLKEYAADPGFKELEVNCELNSFTPACAQLMGMERAFAAISHVALQQRQVIQDSIQSVLTWSCQPDAELSPETLREKFQEAFGGSVLKNDAILQIACGKRAEIIEHRRDRILEMCKTPAEKSALVKIPPTVTHLFNEDKLISQLQRLGGASKVFRAPFSHTRSSDFLSRPKSGTRAVMPTQCAPAGNLGSTQFPSQYRRADPGHHSGPSSSASRGRKFRRPTGRGQTSHRRPRNN